MGAIAETQPPFWIDVRLDLTVLAFVTAITVAAALVSSVAPGLRVSRTDATSALKDDTRGATSLRMGRFSRWLVVVEVAVSCILLVVSGLMIRSILTTSRIDYGFATRDVFFAQVSFDTRTHADNPAVLRALEQFEEGIKRVPGVRHVALLDRRAGQRLLADVPARRPDVRQARRPAASGADQRHARLLRCARDRGPPRPAVHSGRHGRRGSRRDRGRSLRRAASSPAARRSASACSSVTTARRRGSRSSAWCRVWRNRRNPGSGRRIDLSDHSRKTRSRGVTVLARTGNDPVALTSGIRGALSAVSPETPLNNPNSLAAEFWRQGWAFRLFGGLFLTFGAAALILAAAGFYGVMSFTVRRRTQEIGVRMALGASQRSVLRMVLWQGLWRVAVGVAIGLWPGWFVGTQMQALTSDVSPADPVVHVTTAVTLLISGAIASLVPAMRASSVDPLTALRRD